MVREEIMRSSRRTPAFVGAILLGLALILAACNSSPLPSALAACATRDLSVRLGSVQAASGTLYQVIDFTNISGQTCTLFGFPSVSFAGGTPAIQIGVAAGVNPASPRVLITLAPGAVASTLLQYYDAAFFKPSTCSPRSATFLRVYPPRQTTPVYLADNIQVCLKPNVQRVVIDAMQAGTGG